MKKLVLLLVSVCVLALALAGPATAGDLIPTKLHAHSFVADVNDHDLQANARLRPSAHAMVKETKAPIAGRYVQFFGGNGKGLCAVLTDGTGYAECPGIVRLTYALLALGDYKAVFPAQGPYAKSTDTGQILTIGSFGLLNP